MKVTINPRGECEINVHLDDGTEVARMPLDPLLSDRAHERLRADLERMIEACVGEALANRDRERVAELRGRIERAIEVSNHGSQGDAIQAMLYELGDGQ